MATFHALKSKVHKLGRLGVDANAVETVISGEGGSVVVSLWHADGVDYYRVKMRPKVGACGKDVIVAEGQLSIHSE